MTLRNLIALSVTCVQLWTFTICPAKSAFGQTTATSQSNSSINSTDLTNRLEAIEKSVEEKRKENGVPGMALAIVKDDKVIFLKGFGLRDIAEGKPVTPDTNFFIGSATKSFTAMAAILSQDDGKLSLEDSPGKYLPFFKMRDPEMASKVTIRDLLCHRTGLARADMAFASGKLSRDEVIEVNAAAKPMAKLRETFQYNNVMFSAAGAIVGRAEQTTWDAFVTNRIFRPLGMDASSVTIKARDGAPDTASGYEYDGETKKATKAPRTDLDVIAPAGTINSTARDMAKWLRFMIAGGVWNNKRLVSETGYAELIKGHTQIAPSFYYGLGWYLDDWKGHKSVWHPGNLDGFYSQVAFLPDQKLGFVLLTNQNGAAPTANAVLDIVYSNLVTSPPAGTDGAATNSAATKTTAEGSAGGASPSYADLLGSYESAIARGPIEIVMREGKLTWLNQQKQPILMVEESKDHFALPNVPGVQIEPIRDADGRINSLTLKQPAGVSELTRVGTFVPALTVDDLMNRVITASGGEANIRRHRSMEKRVSIDYETQGISADMVILQKAPAFYVDHIALKALGKQIGTIDEYFDGATDEYESSYGNPRRGTLTGTDFENDKIDDDFYGLLNWKTLFATVEIKQKTKLGSEDVLIAVATPAKGTRRAYWISTKSFLVLKETVLSFPRTLTALFEDYREVDGQMIPFKITRTHTVGIADSSVLRIKEVKFDVDIPDTEFRLRQ